MNTGGQVHLEEAERRPRRLGRVGVITGAAVLVLAVAVVGLIVALSLSGEAASTWPNELKWRLEPGETVTVVPADLVRIVDGDTGIYRMSGGSLEKVRMIGIEAPESTLISDRYTMGALAAARRLSGKDGAVFLELGVNERDRYGQLLAYVWLDPPSKRPSASEVLDKMLNAKMVAQGYAHEFATIPGRTYANDRYSPLFVAYASEAQKLGKGLWDPEFVKAAGSSASWIATASVEPTAIASPYVGNRTTLKLHRSSCENAQKMRVDNRVLFDTRDAAIDAGFVPCGICDP